MQSSGNVARVDGWFLLIFSNLFYREEKKVKNAIPYQLSYVVFYSDVELYSMRYVILRIPLLIPLLTIVFLSLRFVAQISQDKPSRKSTFPFL